MFKFVIFSFVITGNINQSMKTKLLKNEEDIFHALSDDRRLFAALMIYVVLQAMINKNRT